MFFESFQVMFRMERQLMVSPMEFTCQLAIFALLEARFAQGNFILTLSILYFFTHRLNADILSMNTLVPYDVLLVLLNSLRTWRR